MIRAAQQVPGPSLQRATQKIRDPTPFKEIQSALEPVVSVNKRSFHSKVCVPLDDPMLIDINLGDLSPPPPAGNFGNPKLLQGKEITA